MKSTISKRQSVPRRDCAVTPPTPSQTFHPVALEKPLAWAITSACSGSVVRPFWTFQGNGILQQGLPRERKRPPGRRGDRFWAGCPNMDKTHSPDSMGRGPGPGAGEAAACAPWLPAALWLGLRGARSRMPVVPGGRWSRGLRLHLRCL